MTVDEQTLKRLQFLCRVIERQSRHLALTTSRLFLAPFTLAKAKTLESDDDLSERVDAFVSRFSRMQDTLGDKLLPHLLLALSEEKATQIDKLDKAEQLGWITSVDEWLAIRKLRNQMVHEYIEDLSILPHALCSAEEFVPELLKVSDRMCNELKQRGWTGQ